MPDLQIPTEEHYREAIDAVRKRVPVPRETWDRMQFEEREHAFTVSQVARTQVLQGVLDAIDKAVTTGTAITDFRDEVAESLIGQWGEEIPGRIETIFRTNIQCVLPGQMVSGRVVAASRTVYDGEALQIRTKAGRRVAVTPNHPILTLRGFVAAQQLRHGDRVLCNRGCVQDGVAAGIAQECKQHGPSTIDEIFRALANARRGSVRSALRPFDLHGDAVGADGYVDVVRTNRKLLQDLIARGSQAICHVVFTKAVAGLALKAAKRHLLDFGGGALPSHIRSRAGANALGISLAILRRHAFEKERSGSTRRSARDFLPAKEVVKLGQGQPGGLGQFWDRFALSVALKKRLLQLLRDSRFQSTSFGATANRNPKKAQSAQQNRRADSSLFGELLAWNTGLVELDEVVEIGNRNLRSHVYDLQTDDGFYSTGQIYVSNCSYAEGRHAINSAPAVREARPFWRYNDTDNDRECELCHECHGVILPADDPFWLTHYAPLHHQCECSIDALTPEEAEEEGVTSSDDVPDVEADDGFGNQPSSEGEDWAPDLTKIDPELRQALEAKLAEFKSRGWAD